MPELKAVQRPQPDERSIVLLVDEETGTRLRSGRFVPDRGSVEARVQAQLAEHYGNVKVVPFTRDVVATIEELRAADPDLVFNLTEWLDGDRSMDAAITGLLDLLRIPYTGTGPDGMRLSYAAPDRFWKVAWTRPETFGVYDLMLESEIGVLPPPAARQESAPETPKPGH